MYLQTLITPYNGKLFNIMRAMLFPLILIYSKSNHKFN